VAGDTSGSSFDTFDVSLEQKFDTGTYLGLSGEILYSKLDELEGDFVFLSDSPLAYSTFPLGLNKALDYRERSLTFTLDQLLGRQWSVGARYRLSQASLDASYVDVPANLPAADVDPPFQARQNLDSVLHTLNLHANWNHPSGLFSTLEGNWYHQHNSGFSPAEPGDDFWQFNAYAGCRFWHRRAEFTVGLLNLTGQDVYKRQVRACRDCRFTFSLIVLVSGCGLTGGGFPIFFQWHALPKLVADAPTGHVQELSLIHI